MYSDLTAKTEQDKVIELMCQILELNENSEKVVTQVVKEKGVKGFFNAPQDLDIDDDELERVVALKMVIETKEQAIAAMEGGKSYAN